MIVGHDVVQGPIDTAGCLFYQAGLICRGVAALVQPTHGERKGGQSLVQRSSHVTAAVQHQRKQNGRGWQMFSGVERELDEAAAALIERRAQGQLHFGCCLILRQHQARTINRAEFESAAAVQSYRDYLLADSREQQALGRFERAPNVKLSTVNEWLEAHKVVPDDVRLGVWIAFSLFAVCLANAAGLLSAKFLRRSSEIGIRRALGATRRSVFVQYLAEAGLLGLLGSVCALPLVALGLWVIRQQPVAYAFMAEIDPWLFLELLVLAVLVTAVVGGLPAWRACRVAPAIQVKSL